MKALSTTPGADPVKPPAVSLTSLHGATVQRSISGVATDASDG